MWFTCSIDTSFLSCSSCLVGNLSLSMTLIATSRPVFLCLPVKNVSNLYWHIITKLLYLKLLTFTLTSYYQFICSKSLSSVHCSKSLTSVHCSKLTWAENIIRKYLVQLADILQYWSVAQIMKKVLTQISTGSDVWKNLPQKSRYRIKHGSCTFSSASLMLSGLTLESLSGSELACGVTGIRACRIALSQHFPCSRPIPLSEISVQ